MLPRKPAPVVLEGERIRLRPLVAGDVEPLHAISCGAPVRIGGRSVEAYDPDERIWRFMSGGPFASAGDLGAWLARHDGPDSLPLTVLEDGHPIGVACFLANAPEHLRIELGAIWYSPVAQGTGANREATRLMLEHAFGLGYRRVEWKCDARNERSRRAALGMGFRFEGIFEAHMIVKGERRDTAWYRMLAGELR